MKGKSTSWQDFVHLTHGAALRWDQLSAASVRVPKSDCTCGQLETPELASLSPARISQLLLNVRLLGRGSTVVVYRCRLP